MKKNEIKMRFLVDIISIILFKTLFKLISGKVEWGGLGLAAFRKELKVMKI